jgi:hypothetical protein
MAPTLDPLHIPPGSSHTIGLHYLTHLHVSNGFDNVFIVVDHLTEIAHFSAVYIERDKIGNFHVVFTVILHIARTTTSDGL